MGFSFSTSFQTVSALPRPRGGFFSKLNSAKTGVGLDVGVDEEQQVKGKGTAGPKPVLGIADAETREMEIEMEVLLDLETNVEVRGMAVQDLPMSTSYVAETKLPTDLGHFRMRAYRIDEGFVDVHTERSEHIGFEQVVLYNPEMSPFGKSGVTLRIHDQCITSEIFFSNRYVQVSNIDHYIIFIYYMNMWEIHYTNDERTDNIYIHINLIPNSNEYKNTSRRDGGDKFKRALKYINEHGGIVIYLQQEGRGVGFANNVASQAL